MIPCYLMSKSRHSICGVSHGRQEEQFAITPLSKQNVLSLHVWSQCKKVGIALPPNTSLSLPSYIFNSKMNIFLVCVKLLNFQSPCALEEF